MQHVLFICSQNRMRSPTAEQVFSSRPDIECLSAGLNDAAQNSVTPALVDWADIVFVMETAHRQQLAAQFQRHLAGKKVVCLDIPDRYDYMDPTLVQLLEAKVTPFLPASDDRT